MGGGDGTGGAGKTLFPLTAEIGGERAFIHFQ